MAEEKNAAQNKQICINLGSTTEPKLRGNKFNATTTEGNLKVSKSKHIH